MIEYSYDDDYDSEEIENDVPLNCYCDGHCPDGEDVGICQVKPGGKCFATVDFFEDDYEEDFPTTSYGCFSAGEMGLMQCKADGALHGTSKSIECCDSGDFCNKDLAPRYAEGSAARLLRSMTFVASMSSLATCLAIALMAVLAYALYRCARRESNKAVEDEKEEKVKCKPGVNNNETSTDVASLSGNVKLSDLMEQTSGSGLPIMVQRTIAKQIEMNIPIGKGRYGEVWLAKWRDEKVAVKVFLSTEERSWRRETDVYQTAMIRHENILGFVASDIKGNNGWTQLLLITDYHEKGSLYDFLNANTVSPNCLIIMCMSIAKGLTHLHSDIFGIHGKPSIAHRDIKSKNILVKKNGECCIADFGLAVTYSGDKLDLVGPEKTGTKRYMAPEILDNRMNMDNFDSFKNADMYACGLVFWEMARRCQIENEPVPNYEVPYFDQVPSDPSFEEMQDVVSVKKIRPSMPDAWKQVTVLHSLSRIIQEMWHDNPAVRLTALRVKKSLNKLQCSDVSISIE